MQTRRYAGYGGISLAASTGGERSQPPVILLHGGGQTRHAWSKAARALIAAGYQVICPDARGHGDSDWSANAEYHPEALAADLRAIAATLDQPPALVGASMGGITSMLALGESAKPFARSLVLVDIAPRAELAGVRKIFDFMSAKPEGFANLDEAADAVAAYNPHRPRSNDKTGLMKNLRQRDGRYFWHWDPKLVTNFDRFNLQDHQHRLEQAARNVRVPTLLVRGGMSDVITLESARELQRLIPGCELVDVAGAGHMIAGDRNDAFNDAILGFLNRHSPHLQPALS